MAICETLMCLFLYYVIVVFMNFNSFDGNSEVLDQELTGLVGDNTVVPHTQMELSAVPETQMEELVVPETQMELTVVPETQMDVVTNPKNEVIFQILHNTCLSIVILYSALLYNLSHPEMYCVFVLEFPL